MELVIVVLFHSPSHMQTAMQKLLAMMLANLLNTQHHTALQTLDLQ